MKYLFGFLFVVGSIVVFGQNEVVRPDIPGELMVDIGLNYWDVNPITALNDSVNLEIDPQGWRSKSLGIYYTKRFPISNKFSMYYGLGLGFEKISLGNNATFESGVLFNGDDNNVENDSLAALAITNLPGNISYDKNKLGITYLDIPLDFRFHPLGTEDGEGLFIGVGGVVGLRMNSKVKLKYEEGDETVIQKVKGKYNLSGLRYGVQARFGFRGVHLFYKQYFSDVFKDEIGGAQPRMKTIGINITGF